MGILPSVVTPSLPDARGPPKSGTAADSHEIVDDAGTGPVGSHAPPRAGHAVRRRTSLDRPLPRRDQNAPATWAGSTPRR